MTKSWLGAGVLGLVICSGLIAWIAIAPESSQSVWLEGIGAFFAVGGSIAWLVALPFYRYGKVKGAFQPDDEIIDRDRELARKSAVRVRRRLERLDP